MEYILIVSIVLISTSGAQDTTKNGYSLTDDRIVSIENAVLHLGAELKYLSADLQAQINLLEGNSTIQLSYLL